MKRVLQQLLVITLLAAGGICSTAQAQHPNYGHRNYAVAPAIVVYGGNTGYGNGYGAGYGGYGNNYGGYNAGYGNYGFAPIYPRSAPYGAGYSGGYQPYQEMYLQRAYYGLGF